MNHPDLERLQQLFWGAMTHPTGVVDYLESLTVEARALFLRTFRDTPDFSQTDRLSVYANGYFFRIASVLEELFPTTAWVVEGTAGRGAFHNLVTDYLLSFPSRSPNIHRVGDKLPDFIKTHEVSKACDAASDLASIELALTRAVDAADAEPLAPEKVADIPASEWDGLRFRFTPSVQLVVGRWNLRPFAEARAAEADVPPISADHLPRTTLVWRRGFRSFFRRLSATEAPLLGALHAEQPLGAACEQLADDSGLTPNAVVESLRRWLHDGLIVGFEYGARAR